MLRLGSRLLHLGHTRSQTGIAKRRGKSSDPLKPRYSGYGKLRLQTGQRLGRFAGAVAEKAVPLPSAVRHSELLTRWGACHANAILVTIDLRERVVGDEWLSTTTEPIRARMNETPLALAFATSPGAYRGRV